MQDYWPRVKLNDIAPLNGIYVLCVKKRRLSGEGLNFTCEGIFPTSEETFPTRGEINSTCGETILTRGELFLTRKEFIPTCAEQMNNENVIEKFTEK